MPMAIPLVASALTISAGVTAFAAATTITGMVLAGAMVAGGALSIVGTVTGNQKLAKIGGVLGLVGGLGTMAYNAMSSTATEIAADAASDAVVDGAADAAGKAVGDAAGNAAADAAGGLTSSPVDPGGAATVTDLPPLDSAAGAAPTDGGVIADKMASAASAPAGDAAAAAAGGAPAAPTAIAPDAPIVGAPQAPSATITSAPQAPSTGSFLPDNWSLDPNTYAASQPSLTFSGAPTAEPGMFDKFSAWTKENPMLAMTAGQALSGAGQGYMQSRAAEDAREDAEAARKARIAALGRGIVGSRMATYVPGQQTSTTPSSYRPTR